MSKEIFFFATKSDMIGGLKEIEQAHKIKYVKCGGYDFKDYIEFESIDKFNNLGINTIGNHQGESYLILDAIMPVVAREIKQSDGGVKYFIDQMANRTSIGFWPSGIYEKDYLVCGHIATISDDINSLELYKFFTKTFIKGCRKMGRYYIGAEAFELSKEMRLITMSINEPVEYDLKVQ